jgi:O-antigen/teichoic acid export membrane protein
MCPSIETEAAAPLSAPAPAPLEGAPGAGVGRRFSRSVRDNVLAECVIQGTRLGAMVVLARVLGAAEFGVFRVLMVVGMFSVTGLQPGVLEALVQRRDLRPVHESTAWFISIALGLGGVVVLYAGAPVIARLMVMPRLVPGVHLICLPIFLDCLAVTSNAWLQRDLRFGTLATAEVAAEFAFVIIALGLLWSPLSSWSLMAGLTARIATRALFLLCAAPRFPRTWPTMRAARQLRRFAAGVWGGNILSTVSANADYILVGRLLGASPLGFYVLAWDLLRFVPDRLYKVAGRVAFPAFCLLQDNDAELARGYRNFLEYIGRLVLPVAACAAVAAPELIGTLYGAKWLPAAEPLRLLSFGLALVGLRTGIGAVYLAKGRPAIDIYLHSVRLVMIVAAVCSLAATGLVGISAAMSGVEALISIVGLLVASALATLRPLDLIRAAAPGAKLALGCALATGAGKALAVLCDLGGPLMLVLIALPPAAVFLWLEGQMLGAMVAGAFDWNKITDNKIAGTQLS